MPLSPVYLLVDHTAGHKTLGGFTTQAAARAAIGGVAPGHEWTIFEVLESGIGAGPVEEGIGPTSDVA